VKIHNAHFAFPTRGDDSIGGRIFFIRSWGPRTFCLTRSEPDVPAKIIGSTGRNQVFALQVGDAKPITVDSEGRTVTLPETTDPIRVTISAPDPLPDGYYVQGVYLTVEGAVHPYLSVAPGRRLLPADD
jgi:hypothetical protein